MTVLVEQMAQICDAVQVVGCWNTPDGGTATVTKGRGLMPARIHMCEDFVDIQMAHMYEE